MGGKNLTISGFASNQTTSKCCCLEWTLLSQSSSLQCCIECSDAAQYWWIECGPVSSSHVHVLVNRSSFLYRRLHTEEIWEVNNSSTVIGLQVYLYHSTFFVTE